MARGGQYCDVFERRLATPSTHDERRTHVLIDVHTEYERRDLFDHVFPREPGPVIFAHALHPFPSAALKQSINYRGAGRAIKPIVPGGEVPRNRAVAA